MNAKELIYSAKIEVDIDGNFKAEASGNIAELTKGIAMLIGGFAQYQNEGSRAAHIDMYPDCKDAKK